MIIDKKKKGNITIYYVDKDYDDTKLKKVLNKKLKRDQIKDIIDDDADVYTADGKLLLRFRKNILTKIHTDDFYENIIKFATNTTSNRGSATGSKNKNISDNPKIMTNIFGYFDKLSPSQKVNLKKLGKTLKIHVRECRFNMDYPENYKKTIPLIKEIDNYYEKLIPNSYKLQRKKSNQTHFKIEGTSFTTVTTNVNFQTTVHTDKGDDDEGFGNLSVIEHGKYTGGETCFPQYGIGVDVRTGDLLFMDVHQPHANLPIILETPDAKRLSIVCYLRKQVWLKTKGKSKKFMMSHNKTIKNSRRTK
jgi:hypothetical protein